MISKRAAPDEGQEAKELTRDGQPCSLVDTSVTLKRIFFLLSNCRKWGRLDSRVTRRVVTSAMKA